MKVLITSGGGAKGAFSVGALQFLQENLIDKFDFISGTSTGSLIAGMVAANRLDVLTDVYLNTVNADVLKPLNLIESLQQGKPFIYDTEPLFKQIDTRIDAATFNVIMQSSTILCFNAVCLQTGKLTVFSTKALNESRHYDRILITNRDSIIKAMLASSNQAVFMDPVSFDNNEYVDGGNKEVVPTRVVVNNLSGTEDHEVYVLSNNPNELVQRTDFTDMLKVLMRSISVFIQEVRENDLEVLSTFKKISPSHIKVFYIRPDEDLDPEFSTGLRFSKLLMQKWMNMGRRIAKQITRDFPDGNFPLA
ncbi:MAG TPA: patatin-like phospholipase family protein [Chitinophagaceae bacterium]|jgi:predicted acylesterase/phospholipase RssA|nr:patatin-like phospholipase family protein [Chitinophagaceae bacterium]